RQQHQGVLFFIIPETLLQAVDVNGAEVAAEFSQILAVKFKILNVERFQLKFEGENFLFAQLKVNFRLFSILRGLGLSVSGFMSCAVLSQALFLLLAAGLVLRGATLAHVAAGK